jgi:hypothetical protein
LRDELAQFRVALVPFLAVSAEVRLAVSAEVRLAVSPEARAARRFIEEKRPIASWDGSVEFANS